LSSKDALNNDINKAVKRYSSLFTLPSHRTATIWLFVGSLFVGVSTILPIIPSFHGVLLGFAVGVIVFILATLADLAINLFRFKSDSVLNLRRCFALSLYSNLLWIVFILLGGFSYLFLNDLVLWLRLFLLGLCAIIILRLLVFSAISFAGSGRIIFYSILQPGLYTMPLVFMQGILGHVFTSSTLYFFTSSLLVGVLAAFCFMFFLNRTGTKIIGVKLLSVLKVFMANWAEDLNEPLESLLEKLSVERSIKLSVMMFRAGRKVKAAIVVPTFHPGPFKNVGSSALPYLIQRELENKLKCVISVPHGLSGHDLDLTSQAQNQKIVDVSNFDSATTHFVRAQKNGANSSCQIFGKCALFTLTLAPQTMEDLPSDLESFITEESRKRGVSMAMAIDAHNSIEGPFHIVRAISPIKKAVVASLETALNCLERSERFSASWSSKFSSYRFQLERRHGSWRNLCYSGESERPVDSLCHH
jgi:predicted neutral ceramidase superfamily lipid hydrolase